MVSYAVICGSDIAKSLLKREKTRRFFIFLASPSLRFFILSLDNRLLPLLLERGLYSAARLSAAQSPILSPAVMMITD